MAVMQAALNRLREEQRALAEAMAGLAAEQLQRRDHQAARRGLLNQMAADLGELADAVDLIEAAMIVRAGDR